MLRVAVIGIRRMARCTARRPVIPRLFTGSQKPQVRIIQPGFCDVNQWHRNAISCAGAAVRLADIWSAGLVQLLQEACHVGQTNFRKLGTVDLATPLKHTKHVCGSDGLPRWQGRQAF